MREALTGNTKCSTDSLEDLKVWKFEDPFPSEGLPDHLKLYCQTV